MGSLITLSLFALAASALELAAKYEHRPGLHEHPALQKRLYNCFYPAGTPADQVCAVGCGSNFTYCTNYYDCFNPVAGDKCCPDGGYCYANEYCAQDAKGNGYCCPISRPCTDVTSVATYPGGYLTSTPSYSVAAATTTSSRSSSTSTASTATVSKTASSSTSLASTSTGTSTTNPVAGAATTSSSSLSTKSSATSSQTGTASTSTGLSSTSTRSNSAGVATTTSAAIGAQTTNAAPVGADGRLVVAQAIGGLALAAAFWL